MTDKDRELERYLGGKSPLSRHYREASREGSPPELDEKVLALARAEVRRKPGLGRALAPVALAASVIFGLNLAWNVHEARPLPEIPTTASGNAAPPAERKPLDAADPPMAKAAAPMRAEPAAAAAADRSAAEVRGALQDRKAAGGAQKKERASMAAALPAPAPAPARAAAPVAAAAETSPPAEAARPPAPKPVLSEQQKIDRLIAYIGGLQGAVFIRNGDEHTPAEAVAHLQMKREKAGDRVKTADDFIRLCASHSFLSGKAYQIRFPDGRTRTSEEVLREELAKLQP
jgi:hypothetical protein